MSVSSGTRHDLREHYTPPFTDFLVGDRNRYLTTDGYYSSGYIKGSSFSSGTIKGAQFYSPKISVAQSSTNDTSTTVTKISAPGWYYLDATAGSICRVDTSTSNLPQWSFLYVTNIATAATGCICFSTGETVYVNTSGGFTYIDAGKTRGFIRISAALWNAIENDSGQCASNTTAQVGS